MTKAKIHFATLDRLMEIVEIARHNKMPGTSVISWCIGEFGGQQFFRISYFPRL